MFLDESLARAHAGRDGEPSGRCARSHGPRAAQRAAHDGILEFDRHRIVTLGPERFAAEAEASFTNYCRPQL
jgi:hypothetical protein